MSPTECIPAILDALASEADAETAQVLNPVV